jgi:hypothetical protein
LGETPTRADVSGWCDTTSTAVRSWVLARLSRRRRCHRSGTHTVSRLGVLRAGVPCEFARLAGTTAGAEAHRARRDRIKVGSGQGGRDREGCSGSPRTPGGISPLDGTPPASGQFGLAKALQDLFPIAGYCPSDARLAHPVQVVDAPLKLVRSGHGGLPISPISRSSSPWVWREPMRALPRDVGLWIGYPAMGG